MAGGEMRSSPLACPMLLAAPSRNSSGGDDRASSWREMFAESKKCLVSPIDFDYV
jgi:hypothetical protein